VLWSCLAGGFATSSTITVLGVSLKTIAADLGSQVSIVAWVITAPMLAQAVSAPLLGKLGDVYGHRRVYLSGFAFATLAAGTTAFAWDASSLIGLRTIAQLAGTATMPASMALLFRAYDGRERVKAMGWMSVVFAGAPVLGLAVGGVLVEAMGWRPLFWIQSGFSLVACAAAFFVLVETPRRTRVRIDVAGATTLAMAAFALTFSINRLPVWGAADPRVWLPLLAAPALLALFLRVERRSAQPLLPPAFLGRRNFALPLVIGFTTQFAYMGGFIISPLVMMGLFGLGQAATAMWTIARPVTFTLSSPLGGHFGMRLGERTMIQAGSALVLVAMAAFALGAAGESMLWIVAGLILAGLGMGFAQPSMNTIVASTVTSADHGVAVSTMSTATGIGAVAGISILTAVCADATTAVAFRNGYALGAAVAAVGLIASFALDPVEHPLQAPESGDVSDPITCPGAREDGVEQVA